MGERSAVIAAAIAAVLVVGAPPVSADSAADTPKKPTSFWSVTFLGGVLTPLGKMADTHKRALATSTRIAWTHKSGLGIEIQAEYSPLPHRRGDLAPLETYETHFATGTIGPRFVFGKGFARVWASGGGGISYERSMHKFRDDMGRQQENASSDVIPVGVGAAGLELHIMNSGGLVLAGSYTKTFKSDTPRRYYALVGGLVFTFK